MTNQPDTPPTSKVDELLSGLMADTVDLADDSEGALPTNTILDTTAQSLYVLMEEVIGDDHVTIEGQPARMMVLANQDKAKQRAKLRQLFGVEA